MSSAERNLRRAQDEAEKIRAELNGEVQRQRLAAEALEMSLRQELVVTQHALAEAQPRSSELFTQVVQLRGAHGQLRSQFDSLGNSYRSLETKHPKAVDELSQVRFELAAVERRLSIEQSERREDIQSREP